jgi:hypothetical protein
MLANNYAITQARLTAKRSQTLTQSYNLLAAKCRQIFLEIANSIVANGTIGWVELYPARGQL